MTLEELDTHDIHVTTTYYLDYEKPWGYAVQGPFRFVREEANFLSRHQAEKAGLVAGTQEYKRLANYQP